MSIPDLANTKVLLVIFAMPGCGACDEYLPRFLEVVSKFRTYGLPFTVWNEGDVIQEGQIPILVLDAASKDETIQDFADKLKISATPTTALMTRSSTHKIEGSIGDDQIDSVLRSASDYNR